VPFLEGVGLVVGLESWRLGVGMEEVGFGCFVDGRLMYRLGGCERGFGEQWRGSIA
jgi:hypothetical protein